MGSNLQSVNIRYWSILLRSCVCTRALRVCLAMAKICSMTCHFEHFDLAVSEAAPGFLCF